MINIGLNIQTPRVGSCMSLHIVMLKVSYGLIGYVVPRLGLVPVLEVVWSSRQYFT